jgi:nitroreductase
MKKINNFIDVIKKRRSVRKFEKGKTISVESLKRIVDCGRWAPSGANTQCFDFVVINDKKMINKTTKVFLNQAQRLVDFAKGFPAVNKTYLANTVAIIIVIGDPRWKVCFPHASSKIYEKEYNDNNEAIFLCSVGAAIQNIQLGVTAEGLTSAWLSGAGEETTNRELSKLLGYPNWMKAYGTIPIGYPAKTQNKRYRRPLEQCLHWNKYEPKQYRTHSQVDFYESTLRPFAMYRNEEKIENWPDFKDKLGNWANAFSLKNCNKNGKFEIKQNFSKPRTEGRSTRRRKLQ